MVELKSPQEIEKIRAAGKIVAQVLKLIEEEAKPGTPTSRLDKLAEEFIRAQKATPAFLNYRGYPATLCISIDSEVVHGIPSPKRIIKEGHLVSVDVGVKKNGFYGDAARSFFIGEPDELSRKLIQVTRDALERATEQAWAGNFLGDISFAVQSHAEENGFSVVRDLVGHGIGKQLHEEPQIPNYGSPRTGIQLKEGMTLAIEPMVNVGTWMVKMLSDNWTVVTNDGSLSAHFENTIAVTKEGPEILSVL